jgi:hypothetical protein
VRIDMYRRLGFYPTETSGELCDAMTAAHGDLLPEPLRVPVPL